MSSALVPYEGERAVGLVEGFRLNREARQRNVALERMGGNFALAEARANLDSVASRNGLARSHELALQDQHQIAERGYTAVMHTSALVDHAINTIAGDRAKATYVEPIVALTAAKIQRTI